MKEIIIAIVTSSAFSAIVSSLITAHQTRKKRDNGIEAGVRIILYDRIKHLGKAYIERKSISAEELEDLIEMHRIYHDELGGNGYLDTLMANVKKLPII